jgi:hypothetical protein
MPNDELIQALRRFRKAGLPLVALLEQDGQDDAVASVWRAITAAALVLEKAVAAAKPRSTGKPNPLWDCVCEAFGLQPVTRSDRTRVGRIVADLKAKGADPAGVSARIDRYRAKWPDITCTPEALLKHWDSLGSDKPPAEMTAMEKWLKEQGQ